MTSVGCLVDGAWRGVGCGVKIVAGWLTAVEGACTIVHMTHNDTADDTLAPGWEIQVADLLEHAINQITDLVAEEHLELALDYKDAALDLIAVLPAMVRSVTVTA